MLFFHDGPVHHPDRSADSTADDSEAFQED